MSRDQTARQHCPIVPRCRSGGQVWSANCTYTGIRSCIPYKTSVRYSTYLPTRAKVWCPDRCPPFRHSIPALPGLVVLDVVLLAPRSRLFKEPHQSHHQGVIMRVPRRIVIKKSTPPSSSFFRTWQCPEFQFFSLSAFRLSFHTSTFRHLTSLVSCLPHKGRCHLQAPSCQGRTFLPRARQQPAERSNCNQLQKSHHVTSPSQ